MIEVTIRTWTCEVMQGHGSNSAWTVYGTKNISYINWRGSTSEFPYSNMTDITSINPENNRLGRRIFRLNKIVGEHSASLCINSHIPWVLIEIIPTWLLWKRSDFISFFRSILGSNVHSLKIWLFHWAFLNSPRGSLICVSHFANACRLKSSSSKENSNFIFVAAIAHQMHSLYKQSWNKFLNKG